MELFIEHLPFPVVVAAHLPAVHVEGRPPGEVVELRLPLDDPRSALLIPGRSAILVFDDGSELDVAISLHWSPERSSGFQRLLLTIRPA